VSKRRRAKAGAGRRSRSSAQNSTRMPSHARITDDYQRPKIDLAEERDIVHATSRANAMRCSLC